MESEKKEVPTQDTEVQAERTRPRRIYAPKVDILETEDRIEILADMPGVDEASVELTLEKNVLTIYGKVEADIPDRHRLAVSEYGIGDYQRQFVLSNEVDRERIEAVAKYGVLSIRLPKAATAKTRKIAVRAGV